MKEEFSSKSWGDFRQRYSGTFGWYTDKDRKILVMVDQVEGDYCTFYDEKKIQYTANADKGVTFEFLPVEKGLYNVGNDLVLVQRKPARMWRRGISADNTTLWSFLKAKNATPSFENLSEIFSPSYRDFHSEFLAGRRNSIALSKQFGIHDKNVYLYDTKIGVLDGTKIILDDDLFSQEFRDLSSKLRLPYDLEIK